MPSIPHVDLLNFGWRQPLFEKHSHTRIAWVRAFSIVWCIGSKRWVVRYYSQLGTPRKNSRTLDEMGSWQAAELGVLVGETVEGLAVGFSVHCLLSL